MCILPALHCCRDTLVAGVWGHTAATLSTLQLPSPQPAWQGHKRMPLSIEEFPEGHSLKSSPGLSSNSIDKHQLSPRKQDDICRGQGLYGRKVPSDILHCPEMRLNDIETAVECSIVREENQVLVFRSFTARVNNCEPREAQTPKQCPMISCLVIFVLWLRFHSPNITGIAKAIMLTWRAQTSLYGTEPGLTGR